MTPAPRVIAIDGPSGAGKSTVARLLARRLQLPYLDTGAMYRAIGLAARRAGISLPIEGADAVAKIAESSRIDLSTEADGTRVSLDGEDVTAAIREPAISMYASAVSAIPAVRRTLVARQREIGRGRGGVMEGRDIGTRVFPDTPWKFFLTASEEERAGRRHRELSARGVGEPYERVLADLHRRDTDDSSRPDSPLKCDDSYRRIDSDRMTPSEVVDLMVAAIEGGPDRA